MNESIQINDIEIMEELKKLRSDNKKLTRELNHAQIKLDKISKMTEAKDALNNALSVNSERQKSYVKMLISNCPNIMFLLDQEGKFVFSTAILLEELELFSFDYINNIPYDEVFPNHMSSSAFKVIQDAIEQTKIDKKRRVFEDTISFNQKEQRTYSIELLPLESISGRTRETSSGIFAVFIDTTDLVQEKEKAQSANNAKSDFLATMSHEIRTPMNAIMGMTEVLSRTSPSKEQKKYIADIQTSADSLLSIINDILDFSKIEAGKIEIVNSNFYLREFFDNIHSIFKFMFSNKGIDFSYSLEDDVPEVIICDEKRINQIVTNLLSNALKYTKEGSVKMKIWVTGANILRVDVEDTGIGIREEDIDKLFRPFEQLDLSKNKNIVGTGLGLAICYRLAHIMEGDLWVESKYGEGSIFSVGIPYENGDPDWIRDSHEEIADFKTKDTQVLVVDDIEINLDVAEALLNTFQINVDTAISGQDALNLVKEKEYDIVFMDHMMPGMDGIEATKLIRLMGDYHASVPIIALTANAIVGMREMFLEHNFDDFLPKPLEYSQLKRILVEWLPEGKIVR